MEKEVVSDMQKEFKNMLKKAFSGSKHIKIK